MDPLYVRHRIDLNASDIAFGFGALARGAPWQSAADSAERAWSTSNDAIACLSVRSGFDLYLTALGLPEGSEIIMSAVNIPDMVALVRDHKLVPVPVDLDLATLGPKLELLERARTERTRAVVVAHLFGGKVDMGPIAVWARAHGVVLIEDAAQSVASTGPSAGFPGADVSMFSFGPLKTATALGGGILRIRDASVLRRMRQLQDEWPVQPVRIFFRRLLLYSLLVFFQNPMRYRAFVKVATRKGRSIDDILGSLTRGFSAANSEAVIRSLRFRPSVPLLRLLARRIEHFDRVALARRAAQGEATLAALGDSVEVIGRRLSEKTHWLFAALQLHPDRTRQQLWECGVHASGIPSNLAVVPAPADRPELDARECRRFFESAVFTPVYPQINDVVRAKLVRVLREGAWTPRVKSHTEIASAPYA